MFPIQIIAQIHQLKKPGTEMRQDPHCLFAKSSFASGWKYLRSQRRRIAERNRAEDHTCQARIYLRCRLKFLGNVLFDILDNKKRAL